MSALNTDSDRLAPLRGGEGQSPCPAEQPLDGPELTEEPSLTLPVLPFRDPESIKLERRGTTSHADQALLWAKELDWKATIAVKLRSVDRMPEADGLDHCHSERFWAKCGGCHKARSFWNRCDRFYCPMCVSRLSNDRRESVEWWVTQISQPKHVVLTVANTGILTKAMVVEFKGFFAKLRRRAFCRNWKGGFYSLEVTNEGNGWHLHLHALVDCRWIDAGQLAKEWHAANGGCGHIVKVKDCRKGDYLREVTKYAVKGSTLAKWTGAEIATFIDSFTGVRTFGVFGSLYGKRTEWREWLEQVGNDRNKCECGACNWQIFNELEWEWEKLKSEGFRPLGPPPAAAEQQISFYFPKEPFRLV